MRKMMIPAMVVAMTVVASPVISASLMCDPPEVFASQAIVTRARLQPGPKSGLIGQE